MCTYVCGRTKRRELLVVEKNTFLLSRKIAFPEMFPISPYLSSGKLWQLASTTSRRRRASSSTAVSTAGEVTGMLELLSGEGGLGDAPSFAPLWEPSPPPLPPVLSAGKKVCVAGS